MKFSFVDHPKLLDKAMSMAAERHKRWAGIPGRYNNPPWQHLIGAKGEVVASELLWAEIVNDDAKCDLMVGKHRIEVKTFSYDTWEAIGPVVSVDQLNQIKKKADLIVWVVGSRTEFSIVGWTEVCDIDETNVVDTLVGTREIKNISIPSINDPMLLIERLGR